MNVTQHQPSLLALLLLVTGTGYAADMDNCDLDRGEKLYSKCAICHTNDDTGQHGAGPNLHSIIGRDIASVPDFPYSEAMLNQPGVWTEEALSEFIADPLAMIPGTTKAFAGIKKAADRKEVICYLRQKQ